MTASFIMAIRSTNTAMQTFPACAGPKAMPRIAVVMNPVLAVIPAPGKRWCPIPTVVERSNGDIPDTFTLFANYPNPFNPSTTICYSLPISADIRLNIYNLKREKVRRLINQHQSAGIFEITWNGCNDNNVQVASGTFINRMEMNAGGKTVSQSRQMVLFK